MAEDIVKGLQILLQYAGENFLVYAEHDVIYAGAEVNVETLSTEDQQAIEATGWHYGDCNGEDGWYHFV
jgi:hypothetical protein